MRSIEYMRSIECVCHVDRPAVPYPRRPGPGTSAGLPRRDAEAGARPPAPRRRPRAADAARASCVRRRSRVWQCCAGRARPARSAGARARASLSLSIFLVLLLTARCAVWPRALRCGRGGELHRSSGTCAVLRWVGGRLCGCVARRDAAGGAARAAVFRAPCGGARPAAPRRGRGAGRRRRGRPLGGAGPRGGRGRRRGVRGLPAARARAPPRQGARRSRPPGALL